MKTLVLVGYYMLWPQDPYTLKRVWMSAATCERLLRVHPPLTTRNALASECMPASWVPPKSRR